MNGEQIIMLINALERVVGDYSIDWLGFDQANGGPLIGRAMVSLTGRHAALLILEADGLQVLLHSTGGKVLANAASIWCQLALVYAEADQ